MSSSKGRNSRPSKPAEAASGISLPAEIWPADKYCEQTCKKNLYDARDGYKDMKALQAWKSTIPNPYVFAKELQEGFADTWVNEHHWDLICQHGPEYTLITKVNIYRSHVVTGSRNQNWVFAATVTKDVFVDKEEQLFIYQTPTTNLQGRAGGKQIINPFYSPL